jgi:hypothetical protein
MGQKGTGGHPAPCVFWLITASRSNC